MVGIKPRSSLGKKAPRGSEQRPSWAGPPDDAIWLNPELFEHQSTAVLDDQEPATLYYLGKIINIPSVLEVYVDQKATGELKHWAVIEERDVDIMDQVYDIELDTREKFPHSDLNFRVTVYTDDGPSAADQTMKIFERG